MENPKSEQTDRGQYERLWALREQKREIISQLSEDDRQKLFEIEHEIDKVLVQLKG